MYVPIERLASLAARDHKDDHPPNSKTRLISIICAGIVGFFIIICTLYYGLKHARRRHPNPTYIPTRYLSEKWRHWAIDRHAMRDGTGMEPMGQSRRLDSNTTLNNASTRAGGSSVTFNTPRDSTMAGAGVQRQTSTRIGNSVNRNQSVRSIMTFKTLPEYSEEPGSEELAWKAGERAGMDSVVQLPDEAAIAEERRREEEMEAQYHLRLARQNVRDGREVRRAARESGDAERVREANILRDRIAEREELERLRAEHDAVRKRPRAVSKVDYGNLGLVAAGGSRIRANSEESERPLLTSAAGMAEDEGDLGNGHSGAASIRDFPPPEYEGFDNNAPSPAYTSPTDRQSSNSFFRPPPQSPSPPSPVSPQRTGSLRQLTPQPQPISPFPVATPQLGLGFEDVNLSGPQASVSADVPAPLYFRSRSSSSSPTPAGGVTPPLVISKKESVKMREQPPNHIALPPTQRFSMPPQPSSNLYHSPGSGSGSGSSLGVATPPPVGGMERQPSSSPINSNASLGASVANPARMDTVQRRRRSINDLMGGAGRPASAEIPKKQKFVLHTPPISSPSPPIGGPMGGSDSRRTSLVGMLPKLGRLDELSGGAGGGRGAHPMGMRNSSSTSLNSVHSLENGPVIMVESATPVVGRGKAPLGWETGGSERKSGTGVSGR